MSGLDRGLVVVPAPGIRFRELDGEGVLIDLEVGTYFRVNATGARIWQELAAGGSLGVVLDRLREGFEVDDLRLASELDAFVRDLLLHGLVQRAP